MANKVRRTGALLLLAALIAAGSVTAWLASAAPDPTPQQVRQWTAEILSSGGYQVNPPLWWRVERAIFEGLGRLVGLFSGIGLGPFAGLPTAWAFIIVGILLVLLVLILIHILVTVRVLMVERRARKDERVVVARRSSPQEALREAERAAAAGQFVLALRKLYEAALLMLDRRDVLDYDSSRTNWENLQAVATRSEEARRLMSPLTSTVDGCLYGNAPATVAEWKQSRELVCKLWEAGGSGNE